MSVNRKETIRDPNSFGDIDYELLIDFRLTVGDYLHNTPPVKEYSWEEFQKRLNKNYVVGKLNYFVDPVSFEQVLRIWIYNWFPKENVNVVVPYEVRSYFSVLTDKTFDDLEMILGYTQVIGDEAKDIITLKINDYETKEITKK